MLIITMNVKSFEEFRSKVEILQSQMKVVPRRYVVCVGGNGIVFVPTVSSRHTHVIVFYTAFSIKDFQDAVEYLQKLGFNILEHCTARPEAV